MILSTGGFRPSLTLWGFRFGLENERRPGPDNANAPHNFPNSRPVNASTSRVIVVGVLTPAPDNDNAPEASYAPSSRWRRTRYDPRSGPEPSPRPAAPDG